MTPLLTRCVLLVSMTALAAAAGTICGLLTFLGGAAPANALLGGGAAFATTLTLALLVAGYVVPGSCDS
jgi:hypothetical protein